MDAAIKRVFQIPWVARTMQPVSKWYVNAAGYRQLGLRYDDLIPEENDTVQLALRRLPPKEAYDRVYRLRRAFQCSLEHQILPPEQQTTDKDDIRYLQPYIEEIEREKKERADLDNLVIKR
ncbi:hypothetical protein VTO42DRAFT_3347 [Malbranchea cinnamomea]